VKPIHLPAPALKSKVSVSRALRLRHTTHALSTRKLSAQLLGDLCWAACGVNRAQGPFGLPGRTAASASNSQEVDLYVAREEGTYLYAPLTHRLTPVVEGDLRALAIGRGQHGLGAGAPVRLIFVADVERLANTKGLKEPGLLNPDVQRSYYFVDTGLIAANVYLFAASEGLGAWFHNCDAEALAGKLGLRPEQRALFGQSVGYPGRALRRGAAAH
jgi:nitroreductase